MSVELRAYMPIVLTVTNSARERSAAGLLSVVDTLDPARSPRYHPRDLTGDGKRETFCNIFLWDFSRSMEAEIPHWIDPVSGDPGRPGQAFKELNANGVADWLREHGSRFGWHRADASTARVYALAGKPAAAVWKNPIGIGHVAVLIPAPDSRIWIAQAGASCFKRGTLAEGFGAHAPGFWIHE